MKEKTREYINFRFNLTINELKNFTNFISELKQKEIKFKIIRHENKRNAFTQRSLNILRKTNALIDGHFFIIRITLISIYTMCKIIKFSTSGKKNL